MPELPDVEHFRRYFEQHAAGRRVEHAVVTDPGILRNITARALDRALRGERFEPPGRHGKWLLAPTTGPTVLLHFGMTGDLEWAARPEGRHRHDRVIFVLDRGELRYRNMRKLGGLWLAHDDLEVEAIVGGLGPDALTVSRGEFLRRLESRRGKVKAALMDQGLVAGVGNIIADEVLWQARIHPGRPIDSLSAGERDLLFTVLRRVLRRAVDSHDYVSRNRRWLSHVRGEVDARCPRCHTPLGRMTIGGRTSYFCPVCQD